MFTSILVAVDASEAAQAALRHACDIAETYNANDGALLKMHRRVKRALDPAGILAPGKNGIWPIGETPETES